MGEDNAYDLQTLRYEKSDFTASSFDAFRRLAKTEHGTHWQPLTLKHEHVEGAPKNTGATAEYVAPGKSEFAP